MDGPVREMTLTEWVDRLPPVHDARKELATLLADLAAARAEIERVREETIEACAKVAEGWALPGPGGINTDGIPSEILVGIDRDHYETQEDLAFHVSGAARAQIAAFIRALSRPATGGTT